MRCRSPLIRKEEAGRNAHQAKPLKIEDVIATIAQYTKKKENEGEGAPV